MIKELIFQKQKWYQGEVPNYVGKVLKMPHNQSFTYTFDLGMSNGKNNGHDVKTLHATKIYDDQFPANLAYDVHPTIIGQILADNSVFLLVQNYENLLDSHHFVWIKLSEFLQNGGVSSSSLTHLYRGLRHLLNRKVALVDD